MRFSWNKKQAPYFPIIVATALVFSANTYSGIDWVSSTFDNDFFLGEDSGYSNGLFFSFYDTGRASETVPESDFWVKPLSWSLSVNDLSAAVNSYTIGQTMRTPQDIRLANPPETQLPYSALVFLTNTYLVIGKTYTDKISTTIGMIGPEARGEEAQKLVHAITGSEDPKGWDTQLKNELVFQFVRARAGRNWVADSGNMDLLTHGEMRLGTIASKVNAGILLRYGRDLGSNSYGTALFNYSRTANPLAINGGWYFYGGFQVGYTFNQVFTDGNNFRNSRSIDYDRESLGVAAGLAYSWQNISLTLAISDANIIQRGEDRKELEGLNRYGSLTVAWRI